MSKVDWKKLVKGIAPAIGTALGGPAGGLAVAAISESLLGKKDGTESEVAEAVLSATPDKLLELKKIDNDFKLQMEQLGLDVFKAEVDDKKSARELFKANMYPQIILSGLFVFGYFLIALPMIFGKIDPPDTPMLAGLILVLTTNLANIMQFWFGSSHGSKTK